MIDFVPLLNVALLCLVFNQAESTTERQALKPVDEKSLSFKLSSSSLTQVLLRSIMQWISSKETKINCLKEDSSSNIEILW